MEAAIEDRLARRVVSPQTSLAATGYRGTSRRVENRGGRRYYVGIIYRTYCFHFLFLVAIKGNFPIVNLLLQHEF